MTAVAESHVLPDARARAELQAYNAAFEELGLNWQWDTVQSLRTFLQREQPHLLKAYDADFLVNAIESTRRRCEAAIFRES